MPSTSRERPPGAETPALWRIAAGTGIGAALVCAILGVVAVAICWLPISAGHGGPPISGGVADGGGTSRTGSAISAGLLTYLAALHGGITVDGTFASWVPLGMTLIAGAICWRAGRTLAIVAGEESDSGVLVRALLVQAGSFTAIAVVAVPFAELGTSGASYLGVGFAAALLFLVVGGASFVRSCGLRDEVAQHLPALFWPCVRVAVTGLAAYVGAGALLVAGSLLVHHERVTLLAGQVGGGWGSVPILLLGVLAAPNAAIAGAGYRVGPGFAVGSGTAVTATSSAHGLLPAFPLLGAVPSGPANPVVWTGMALTAVLAGCAAAAVISRMTLSRWWEPFALAAAAAAGAGALGALGAWFAGGGIGGGALGTIGVPAGWFGLFLAGVLAVGTSAGLLVALAWRTVRLALIDRSEADLGYRPRAEDEDVRPTLAIVPSDLAETAGEDGDGDDKDRLAV